jgi:8-oxo-dGTP diphosphatase
VPENDSREYPARPICAVGAIVRRGETVLLIQRGKAPRGKEWSIPGGAVEIGETLQQAAQREIQEECNIDIAVGGLVDTVDIIQRDAAGRVQYHYVIVDLAADYVAGELQASSDAALARWIPISELDQYPLNAKTLEVILKGIRPVT